MSNPDVFQLVEPARYFPLPDGRYQVKVGLSRLGVDYGNGRTDRHAFQLDSQWPHYRQAMLTARAENLGKYYATDPRAGSCARRALVQWMLQQLCEEHPDQFQWERNGDASGALRCRLSGETIEPGPGLELVGVQNGPAPGYADTLDALASQVQEDIALVEVDDNGADRLSALHLCFPNYWAASSRIGKDFGTLHRPVPGFDRIARQHRQLIGSLVTGGPFVRFAWGLTTDARLNHHPEPPPGFDDPAAWHGRRFDPAEGQLYLRVERQVIQGLTGVSAFAFTIRTYLTAVTGLDAAERQCLAEAVETMPEDARRYKGLAQDVDAISGWLRGL